MTGERPGASLLQMLGTNTENGSEKLPDRGRRSSPFKPIKCPHVVRVSRLKSVKALTKEGCRGSTALETFYNHLSLCTINSKKATQQKVASPGKECILHSPRVPLPQWLHKGVTQIKALHFYYSQL